MFCSSAQESCYRVEGIVEIEESVKHNKNEWRRGTDEEVEEESHEETEEMAKEKAKEEAGERAEVEAKVDVCTKCVDPSSNPH